MMMKRKLAPCTVQGCGWHFCSLSKTFENVRSLQQSTKPVPCRALPCRIKSPAPIDGPHARPIDPKGDRGDGRRLAQGHCPSGPQPPDALHPPNVS